MFTYKLWLHIEKWDEEQGIGIDQGLPYMLFESENETVAKQLAEALSEHCNNLDILLNEKHEEGAS